MNFVKTAFATTAAIATLGSAPAVAQTYGYGYAQPQYQQNANQTGHYVWQNGQWVWQQNSQSQYAYSNSQYANQGGHYVYRNGQYVWQPSQPTYPNTQYGYQQPYGNAYAYGNGYNNRRAERFSAATQQCSAAVQNKLQTKQGLASTIASLVGVGTNARIVSVNPATRIQGEKGALRVTGLASSGNFGAYGIGAYGASGYSNHADLSFTCDTNRYGRVTSVTVDKL